MANASQRLGPDIDYLRKLSRYPLLPMFGISLPKL